MRRKDVVWLVLIAAITGIALSVILAPRVTSTTPAASAGASPSASDAAQTPPRQVWLGRDVHTRFGLDLRGGTQVLLRSREPDISAEQLEQARGVIERRVNGLGLNEPNVQTSGTDSIISELPAVASTE